MSISRPTVLGGTIAALDSDSISDLLDASGLPIGTVVWNADVGSFFKLTTSTASLVTDEVLEVLNTTGVRWIIVSAGGVQSVTGPVDNADPENPVITAALIETARSAYNDSITNWTSGNDIDIASLAGDTDGDYEFWGHIVLAAGGANVLTLQPQQLATNQAGSLIFGQDTGAAGGGAISTMSLGINTDGGGTSEANFHGYLTSKSGRNRYFEAVSRYVSSGTPIEVRYFVIWSGTETVITNLRFHSSGGMAAGSYIRLRKLRNLT